MKGLLLKDWYIAARTFRLQLAVIGIMLVLSAANVTSGVAFIFYPVLFAGLLPVNILSIEEKSGWQRMADTLPLPRRTIVSEKYIASLLLTGATVLLMGVLWSIRLLMHGGGDWYGLARVLVQTFCYGMAIPTVALPPKFRFGVEKGRVVMMAVLVMAILVIVWLSMRASAISQNDLAGAMGWHLPPIVIGSAVLLAASWLLSVKLYETREL